MAFTHDEPCYPTIAVFINSKSMAVAKVTSDEVLVTPGLNNAIKVLIRTVCDPDKGVLVPRPFYHGFGIDILN